MSDVSITAASVLASAAATIKQYTAGATITAGQAVYYDSTTNTVKLADANLSAAAATAIGIALGGNAANQPILVCLEDPDFTPGGTLSLSAGADSGVYVLSGTAGGIAPMDDLAAAMYPVILMVAKSTSKAVLKIINGTAVLTA